MSEKNTKRKIKQFHFEIQDYQEECINNIIDIFKQLRNGEEFTKVLENHHKKHYYHFPVLDSNNIDIMMETGTGKTFTFIKTIFELCKNFGDKKFIILVPSVAIREGTKTNFEDTKEYFKGLYANEKEKEIEVFVYEGGNVSAVRQFIGTSHLSVLIMTPSSFSHKENILNRPLEIDIHEPKLFEENQDPPKTYLDCLKRLNPIVIMDEPHRFDGDAFKKYFQGFNNYYLRFGATFPQKKNSIPLSNVAYVLDSITSFRKCLVKKIVVYTQDVVENTDTLVSIENKKAIVNTLTNGIVIRRELGIGSIFNGLSIKKINKDSIVLSDGSVEKIDYSISDESMRAMIGESIKIHFEKEKELFEKGIKSLTLFFIPNNINLYRGANPKIKNFFEEEYLKQRTAILEKLDKNSDYYKYLQNDFDSEGNLQVHKGYFSGDKGKTVDEKIKLGIDEILKDKKKLLSFESPTRFIFSIWALQEGWDNPNVFTICKLSNQGSDISKLQQIGRGLRICVNQNLERQTLKKLNDNQELFWRINNLDVVVSGKEKGFVEAIQNEILSNSFLVGETFTEPELIKILKEKLGYDDSIIIELINILLKFELIKLKSLTDDNIRIYIKSPDFNRKLDEWEDQIIMELFPGQQISEEEISEVENPEEQLSEEEISENQPQGAQSSEFLLQNLRDLFATDTNTFVQRAEKKKEKKKVYIKSIHLQEFQNLWNTINKNAIYVLNNLSEEKENQLIENIKNDIEQLNIEAISMHIERAELNVTKLDSNDAILKNVKGSVSHKYKVEYLELVKTISNNTKTPLSFVVKIFNALNDDFKTNMIANNPELAQREISGIIKKHLIEMIKTIIKYDGLEGEVLPDIFKKDEDNDKTYLDAGSTGRFQKDIEEEFNLKAKWLFEEVIEYDSDFELEIIERDPDIESIEFFGKLPRLKIKTPLGDYNPDFCYAIKSNKGNKVFLVVEAKGYKSSTDVPDDEKAKIDFAKKYFEALSEHYKDKNIKISFKKRIKKTQLANLIKNL